MPYLFTILISIFCIHVANAQAWQITEMNDAPEPISNNAVAEGFVGGVPYLYTFGGLDSTKLYSGMHLRSYRFNTQTNTWSSIAPLPDTMGKIAAGASRVKDKIYIIGGYHVFANGSEVSSNKVHIYDPNSNTYLPNGANIPVPIDDQVQAVWRDSLIYVITGWSNTGNVTSVQIYNPASDSWQAGTSVPNNNSFKSFGASGAMVGDTIYYFGGASMSGAFNIQTNFRKGIINPTNPYQINWTTFSWSNNNGYRMAATTALGKVYWIGGSGVTYNYDGIAYNGSGGVSPLGRILYYEKSNHTFDAEYGYNLPMDLRGIANESDTIKYLVGGMMSGQEVTAKTLRLALNPDSVLMTATHPIALNIPEVLDFEIFPSPVKDFLTVDLSNYENEVQYQLFTTSGVCLRQGVLTEKKTSLAVGTLQAGVYFLQVIDHDKIGCKVVIIQ